MKIDSNIFELYKQSNELRNQIILDFDNQVAKVREIFGTVIVAFVAMLTSLKNIDFIVLLVPLSIMFWIIEGSVKYNQRGYILLSSELQKKMVEAKTEDEVFEIIKKYHSDMNGYYSMRVENQQFYKKFTSLHHTIFMPNVRILYICVIIISLVVFASLKFIAIWG